MLKKIIVISFNLLFLIATTGLPVTVHLCKIMENKPSDFCGITHEEGQHSCKAMCKAKENIEVQNIVKADCCKYLPLETLVTDKFVTNKIEITYTLSKIAVVNYSGIEKLDSQNISAIFLNDASPPSQTNNHIYLDNSLLLI